MIDKYFAQLDIKKELIFLLREKKYTFKKKNNSLL